MTTAGTIRIALTALAALLLTFTASMAQETRPVDVVVMLDTSGSMENLLDATRARVWDVVNELGRMKPTPERRVGLVSFGTDKPTEEQGFIIQHLDLTDDLDEVCPQLWSALITIGTTMWIEDPLRRERRDGAMVALLATSPHVSLPCLFPALFDKNKTVRARPLRRNIP